MPTRDESFISLQPQLVYFVSPPTTLQKHQLYFFFLIRDKLILLASLYCSPYLYKSSFCLAGSLLLFRFQV